MKQLLFLLLFPCFAMAQYQGNGNQKITLGEQTTADGLVWRGRLADTANLLTNKLDTSVYIVLDTATRAMWYYSASATPKWTRLVDSLNNLQGTLSVANGGTGKNSLTANKILVGSGTDTIKSPVNLHWDNTNNRLGVNVTAPAVDLHVAGKLLIDGTTISPKASMHLGEWTGIPFPTQISPHSSIKGDLFIGNIGNNVGRLRLASNVNGGFVLFNGYFNDTTNTSNTIDSTKSYWIMNMRASGAATNADFLDFARSYTGTTTISAQTLLRISAQGNISIARSTVNPTARVHIGSTDGTPSTAPIKFSSSTLLSAVEAGAMEFNGTNLFFSPSTTRHTINHGLTGSATLDFPNTSANTYSDLTISITGAALSDVVSLGIPNASMSANNITYTAWVSAANTVTVRFANHTTGSIDPASGLFKVFVTK